MRLLKCLVRLLAFLAVVATPSIVFSQPREANALNVAVVGGYGDSIVRPYPGVNYRGWGGALRIGITDLIPSAYVGIIVGASVPDTRGGAESSPAWSFGGEGGYDFVSRSGLLARPYIAWGAASVPTTQGGGWAATFGAGLTVQLALGSTAYLGVDARLLAAAIPGLGVLGDVVVSGLLGFRVPFSRND